ncbi:58_t:CDS:1, partial [Dentiscutata heterogama]
ILAKVLSSSDSSLSEHGSAWCSFVNAFLLQFKISVLSMLNPDWST